VSGKPQGVRLRGCEVARWRGEQQMIAVANEHVLPIRIAEAKASIEAGTAKLFVTFDDTNYTGSTKSSASSKPCSPATTPGPPSAPRPGSSPPRNIQGRRTAPPASLFRPWIFLECWRFFRSPTPNCRRRAILWKLKINTLFAEEPERATDGPFPLRHMRIIPQFCKAESLAVCPEPARRPQQLVVR